MCLDSAVNATTEPVVWVVDSSYTGEVRAREGVAERLSNQYDLIPPPPTGNLDHYYEDFSQRFQSHRKHHPEQSVVLINGTGEDTITAIADLKNYLNDDLCSVYLASILPDELNPRLFEYDVIASPQIKDHRITSTLGVAHKITQSRISDAVNKNQHLFEHLNKPVFALLLGGNTMYCNGFNSSYGRRLAERVKIVVESQNASLVISNSRRTPDDTLQTVLQHLEPLNPLFFDWLNSPADLYWGILGVADAIITTGDSISMCSEVIYTGKPLLVDISEQATETYHRKILQQLIDHGAARTLEQIYCPWQYEPVDTSEQIAQTIMAQLDKSKLV